MCHKHDSTSWCIVKRISLQSSTCLCLSTEPLPTNYFLMQQCTPDRSAVHCALCLKTIFESLHDRRGCFPSALKYTFLCSKLAQRYWELVQLGSRTISQLSFPPREKLTDSKTYCHWLADWLTVMRLLTLKTSTYVLIPAARQKINAWKLGWREEGTAHNVPYAASKVKVSKVFKSTDKSC